MGSTVQRFLRATSKINSISPIKKGKMDIRSMRTVRTTLNLKTGIVTRKVIGSVKLKGRSGKELGKKGIKWWISVECISKKP
jgi:hypothetical protein